MEDNFEKLLSDRVTALKKFIRKDINYSNYINEKMYTNQHILIIDPNFIRFSEENRVIDKKKEYAKFEEFNKIKEKLATLNQLEWNTKIVPKSMFKDWVKELKRMTMDQIKIYPNGEFKIFDKFGHWKWSIEGKSEVFEGIDFECDNKLFQNVLNYFIAVGSNEVTIKSNKEFMVISNDGGVKIFICGVLLAEYSYNLWK